MGLNAILCERLLILVICIYDYIGIHRTDTILNLYDSVHRQVPRYSAFLVISH